jgi:hypothetical protein
VGFWIFGISGYGNTGCYGGGGSEKWFVVPESDCVLLTWRLVCDGDRAMYIRATTPKKDGTIYKTFRLGESSRTDRGPRQSTVLNLGTKFSLPEEQWKELANRIEEIITAQKNIFPCPPDIEDLAKIYVQRIIV